MARAPFPKALFAAESVKGPERACVQVIAMAGHGAEDPMGRAQVSIDSYTARRTDRRHMYGICSTIYTPLNDMWMESEDLPIRLE
jgi:hypothetical protein